jgi:predicted nucleic acid-binding protein
MVLVDTSVWIEVFRHGRSLDLEAILDPDEIVTCLPVIQSVLQGFGDDAAFCVAREAICSFPILENPLTLTVIEHAVDLYRTARRQGLNVRSEVDFLIAACALRNDCEVLHRDRDFPALARISRLQQRSRSHDV